MKKLFILLLSMCFLWGCSHSQKESTFMITKDNNLYALYNQDGKQLTDYLYKTFEEVEGLGYLITDSKDQKGFISTKGEEVIPAGTYQTLESTGKMFYASKKVEVKKTENKDKDKKDEKKTEEKAEETTTVKENVLLKSNMYVLNSKGEVLYSADEKTQIMKSGLPVIFKDNEYIVLNKDGEELYHGKDAVSYVNQYQNGQVIFIGGAKSTLYYTNEKEEQKEVAMKESGTFSILASDSNGAILSDVANKKMVYVNFVNQECTTHQVLVESAQIDALGQITLTNANQTYGYTPGSEPVLMTSYFYSPQTYLVRSSTVYGPHDVYKDGKKVGELENVQLYPVATKIDAEIFPVYVRNKGYQYHTFDNKVAFKTIYLSAEPFDENMRAIVEVKENQYALIDETGKAVNDKTYSQIKYIGSSYYAVYNKSGMYGIISSDGSKVFDIEYTTLPSQPIVTYDENDYLLLGKNGRTYVYDIKDDMNEIFSQEGNVVLSEKGYFAVDNTYYTFDGEEIK